MQAQVTIPTARLMLAILIAPVAIFFLLLLLMSLWWGIGIGFGRLLISATFAGVLGAALPLMFCSTSRRRARARRCRTSSRSRSTCSFAAFAPATRSPPRSTC